jgi:dihydroorotate dehydrogenase electron transfer subunit
MSKKEVRDFLIIENRPLNNSNFFIKLKSNENLPDLFPGQFVNIDIPEQNEVFLRRPFSIFEVDYNDNTISLIVKILGKGSKKLTEIGIGKTLNLVLPLGKGFTLPEKSDKVLLVGGGSGMAPMLFLAKKSGLLKGQVHLLIGARAHSDHIVLNEYAEYGHFFYATDDGTFGEKGYVTQHSVFKHSLSDYTKVYACGPLGMMKAVAAEAKSQNIFCEVSLENLMACGFGVCLCCIEPTTKGNLCVCTEGPVFNVNDLKW